MSATRNDTDVSRLVVTLMLCGIAVVLAIGGYKQQVAISRLDRTDRIACEFINKDVATRQTQARTTRNGTLTAEGTFITNSDRLIAVFPTDPKKQTAGLEAFRLYIQSNRDLISALKKATKKNLAASTSLAEKGHELAQQLHC